METSYPKSCPVGNTQEQIRVFIHGPSWTNTMPLNAHAMTVVIPQLVKAGWEMIADKRFARIDVICPSFEEVQA